MALISIGNSGDNDNNTSLLDADIDLINPLLDLGVDVDTPLLDLDVDLSTPPSDGSDDTPSDGSGDTPSDGSGDTPDNSDGLPPGANVTTGTSDGELLTGTEQPDVISGGAGDDTIAAGAGNDTVDGGEGNDIIRGGEGSDVLFGGSGDDIVFGGNSRADTSDGDVAGFEGLSTAHTILGGKDYAVVIGPDGSRDKLFDISFLRFDDGDIELQEGSALDVGNVPFDTLDKTNFNTGERVALLYEAALNRDGDIDLPGLNFYIDVAERDDLSNAFLAADLMTSQEFTNNFGDVNAMSNQAFLEQIYLNVLDRSSDAAGQQFYLDLLDQGDISKAEALADIAVSSENTSGSVEILESLYETTTPETDTATQIAIEWSFVS